jgi:hypothetical protein
MEVVKKKAANSNVRRQPTHASKPGLLKYYRPQLQGRQIAKIRTTFDELRCIGPDVMGLDDKKINHKHSV